MQFELSGTISLIHCRNGMLIGRNKGLMNGFFLARHQVKREIVSLDFNDRVRCQIGQDD